MKLLEKLKVVLYVLLFAGVFTACSDDDDNLKVDTEVELTEQELAEMAAADKFAAANSVIRALALIDELPDKWESSTFEPSVGVAEDAANPDVRKTISTGVDDAEAYFHSIVPDLGLNGNTWSHEGIGTLTFRAVNEAECYAVLDVNLVQMPGLKQLRFVPKEAMNENASFTSFYRVGDIVVDADEVYWICVRPSGGPKNKDYAYFVTFDERKIKTTTYSQDIYDYVWNPKSKKNEKSTKNTTVSGKWKYATNLVEERIAMAAGHTFSLLLEASKKDIGFGFRKMAVMLADNDFFKISTWMPKGRTFIPTGSPQSNKRFVFRQEKKLQTTIGFQNSIVEENGQHYFDQLVVFSDYAGNNNYERISLTVDYDPLSLDKLFDLPWKDPYGYQDKPFDVLDYVSLVSPPVTEGPGRPFRRGMRDGDISVMLMAQMRLKDHGKPSRSYSLVTTPNHTQVPAPDYWGSLKNVRRRYVDDNSNSSELVDVFE